MSVEDQPQPEYSVVIIASGPLPSSDSGGGGGLVHAIAVTQPVQSWTVLRSNQDFVAVADALVKGGVTDLPPCPTTTTTDLRNSNNNGGGSGLLAARHEWQRWLTVMLRHHDARETLCVRNFLMLGVNTIPAQYESVAWTQFSRMELENDAVGSLDASSHGNERGLGHHNAAVDDMEMEDMFLQADDDEDDDEDSQDRNAYDEEDFIPAASERYRHVDEALEEHEIDILQLAGQVEMVDDISSLAQSLGASHLGRSLQLQREPLDQRQQQQQQGGLQLGLTGSTNSTGAASGGIGNAMAHALEASPSAYTGVSPDSVPRLDSFVLLKVIGKGSFGKVFLVKERKTSKTFALKVLRKDNIIKRNQVEHTKTERSVLGYVKHPFIVGMNMAFQSADKLYFVLDYCAGGELFFHLGKSGKFPEPRARFYAAEIILAISYVHSLDIIYRDLKPENVLLDARGHIRLTDFGLSKEGISSSSSGAYSFCGTPEYLAPEILNRQGHGRAVDWWSLGALLYEMLTGLPPFYCQDRERLFEKIRQSELHYPPSVSRPAKLVLKGLLNKDPSQRLGSGPTDAQDIQRHEFFSEIDWNKLANGELPAPWHPEIRSSMDTSQFDSEFTRMPICSPESYQQHARAALAGMARDNTFEGFSFTDRIALYGQQTQLGRG